MTKKLLIDNRYIDVANKKWGREFEIIPSPTLENVAKPVSCHPDMSILRVGEVFLCEKTVYEYYKKYFPEINLISGETVLARNYPEDIAYNVLISENIAIGNFKYTDRVVKSELLKQNIKTFNTNQGYAKCASVVFENCIITADGSIFKTAQEAGLKALKIVEGSVSLPGYNYGFLGGASGFIDGKLLFFGDIKKHPDFEKIREFAVENKILIDYIENYPLTDVGTIIGI